MLIYCDTFMTLVWNVSSCVTAPSVEFQQNNGPFAASGHMVHAGGQAANWDIQNKENSNLS